MNAVEAEARRLARILLREGLKERGINEWWMEGTDEAVTKLLASEAGEMIKELANKVVNLAYDIYRGSGRGPKGFQG